MNKHFTFIAAILLLFSLYSSGQAYTFETGLQAYTYLSGAAPITQADPQGGGFYFSHNFKFRTFDFDGDFLANGQTSAGAFVANDGYVAVYNAPSESHTVVYQALLPEAGSGLVKKSSSALSYKYEGATGNGTLKVEWKNMGITGRHDSEYVNIQVWLNEADKSITYHYGPRNLSSEFSFFSSVFSTPNAQFGTFDNAINVTGNANSPTTTTSTGFSTMPPVTGLPEAGRYYRFKRKSTTGINQTIQATIKLYPVPAKEVLYAEAESDALCSITDVTGKVVLETALQAGTNTINIAQLANGIYCLNVTGESGNSVQKIIVSH